MTLKQNVFFHFFVAGLLGSVVAVAVLWNVTWPDKQYVVLGFSDRWVFYTFPIIGSLLSTIWALVLFSKEFGVKRGALTSVLAFLTFNFMLALLGPAGIGGGFVGGISGYLWVVFSFTFFGFIMFGWILVLIGAFTGFVISRHPEMRANKSLKSGTPQSGAP